MSAENQILKARTKLLIEQPFFGTLALRLKVVEKPEIDTAATDGKHLFYNADFINKLTIHETVGLVAHEVMHCVLQHMTRRQDRHPTIWNVAGDYKINGDLLSTGFILPEGGLVDTEGEFDNDTTDAVYVKLLEDVETIEMPGWESTCLTRRRNNADIQHKHAHFFRQCRCPGTEPIKPNYIAHLPEKTGKLSERNHGKYWRHR